MANFVLRSSNRRVDRKGDRLEPDRFGWYHLVSAVQSRPLLAPLALPPFLCAIELGHVSGEWVVGGFEAKGIAYALIFLGLGDALRWRWDRCWWWMGLASAFHVVVGAWVTLTLLITMVVLEGRQAFRLGYGPNSLRARGRWLFGTGRAYSCSSAQSSRSQRNRGSSGENLRLRSIAPPSLAPSFRLGSLVATLGVALARRGFVFALRRVGVFNETSHEAA